MKFKEFFAKHKKLILIIACAVVLVAVSVVSVVLLIGGGKEGNKKTPQAYSGDGIYYFDANGDEYQLALNESRYTLTMGDQLQTGVYTYTDGTLKLYKADSLDAVKEGVTETLPISVDGDVVTLEYDGGTYRFFKKVNYKVTYAVDGGSAIADGNVVNGKTLEKPVDPVKDGYVFLGWFTDEAFTTPFVFGTTIVTNDVTLYARYAKKDANATEYDVTLIVDGEVLTATTTIGGVAYDLPTPEKADATFAGWYVSDYQAADKLTYQYNGNVLTEDTNLYAVWAGATTQVSVTENSINWTALAAGTEYTVTVKDDKGNISPAYKTTSLTMEYDFASQAAGDYVVNVVANGTTATAYYKNKALDRVSTFTVVEPSVLLFDAVANAEKYVISVDCGNAGHTHTAVDNGQSTNFNFINCAMREGGIKFVVTAYAEGYMSSTSAVYTYNRELGAVTNVAYDTATGELSWNAVANAMRYQVEVTVGDTTNTYLVNETNMSLKAYTGTVTVKVTAQTDGYNSAAATELTYTNNKLAAPVVTLDYDTLKWTAVAGAASYNVKIGAQVYTTTGTELKVPEDAMQKGETTQVSVQAVAENAENSSYYSNELTVKYGEFAKVSYNGGTLSWDAVGGADRYGIRVNNGKEINVTRGALQAEITLTKAGANTLVVTAYNKVGQTLDQATVTVNANEITFDVRGGVAVDAQYYAVGDYLALPEATKEGYTFAGWYNIPGGPANNGAKYEAQTYQGNGAMVLYAHWTPNPYTVELIVVKLVENEATGAVEEVEESAGTATVYYQQAYSLPVLESEDPAKVFGGWFEDNSMNSLQYTDPLGNSLRAWTLQQDHVLYAGWIDLFNYVLNAEGTGYDITAGDGVKYVTEVTVPQTYTNPETMETLPVTGIATGAFANCSMLQTINLPDTIRTIYLNYGGINATGSAFYGCSSLNDINVYCPDESKHNTHETFFHSEDGLLIRHASPNTATLDHGVELYYIPDAREGTLVVPNGVENLSTRVLSYRYKLTKAVIPASVKYIGDHCFYGGAYREIIFETAADGVEQPLEIGDEAFNNLTALTRLDLPARIGLIDFTAGTFFDAQNKLTHINIVGTPCADAGNNYYTSNDGVVCNYDGSELVYFPRARGGEYTVPVEIETIGEKAFNNCSKLTKVIMGDNVEEIKKEAFLVSANQKTSLTEVVFNMKNNTLEIGERAFYGCKALTKVALPSTLISLGTQAFGATQALLSVTLDCNENAELAAGAFAGEDGVGYVRELNVGANAPAFVINQVFSGCQLYTLNIDKANKNFNTDEQGVLYDDGFTKILYYPYGLSGEYTIPATVTEISEGVFENRGHLTTIVIPATVTKIATRAFANCVGLSSLTFAERTEDLTIEANAFDGCLGLETLVLPENMTALANNAFANCTNLANVGIPSTLTNMTFSSAFAGCEYLANVTVADGNTAFKTVGGILYKNKTTDDVSVASELLFVPKGYKGAVVVPSTVTVIGKEVFKDHKGVTSFAFENNTADAALTLGESLFEGAKALTDVRLPDGLKKIPNKMLLKSSVQTVYVPNTVTNIGTQAFAECARLATLTFEDGNDSTKLTFATPTAETSAFYKTPKLTSILLPNRTSAITDFMFAGCTGLTTINFPTGVTSIGKYAFAGCTGLTELVIPDAVTSLGTNTFTGCTNLKTLVLSENITTIPANMCGKSDAGSSSSGGIGGGIVKPGLGGGIGGIGGIGGGTTTSSSIPAYDACTSLETIVIPAKVTKIDKYAFRACTALTSVTFADNSALTTINEGAFVDSGLTSFDMPDTVTTVATLAFAGCQQLTTVTLSEKVTAIPANLFGEQDEVNTVLSKKPHYAPAGITSIVIPSSVKTIGAQAFRNCANLTTVTFEEGCQVNKIDKEAFAGTAITSFDLSETTATSMTFGATIFLNCKQLREVKITHLVTNVNSAFKGCTLTSLEFVGGGSSSGSAYFVDMENGVVYNGDKNTVQLYFGTADELVLEEGIVSIADNAFEYNQTLKKITLPATLTTIGANAFNECSNLATVVAPANIALTTIGKNAFTKSGITSIAIPASVTSLGEAAFSDCTALKKADIYNIMLSKKLFSGCTALEEVNFYSTNGVAFYGYTFENCTSLKTFEFPDKVISMNAGEFMGSGLTTIHIPAGLPLTTNAIYNDNYAGSKMFYNCKDLKTATMDESYTFIPYQMFYASGLESFTLSKNVAYIGTNAFTDCHNLAELIISEGLTTLVLGGSSFAETALTEVDLSGITNLSFVYDSSFSKYSGYHFAGDTAKNPNTTLKKVIFPDCITVIPEFTFRYCTALETVIAKGVTAIDKNAFEGCLSLKDVQVSANLTTISELAFKGCESLTSFDIPGTVNTIGKQAFYQSGLTSVTIGDGVEVINEGAFGGTALTSVYLPGSVTTLGKEVFKDCEMIAKFEVESISASFYTGEYGELYNSFNQLVYFPAAADVVYVELRDGTDLSGTHAFANNQNVKYVVLSAATTNIPANTFSGSALLRIEIPVGVTEIGASAFADCLSLEEVVMPETVTTIGSGAFSGCTALTTINLPKNLATISSSMFNGCTALKTVKLPDNVVTIEASAFANSGLTEIELPEKLTTIRANAFKNTKITSVVIPENVTTLGSEATSGILSTTPAQAYIFADCALLETVVFEGVPETLYKGMFKGCTALNSVTFAEGWTEIAEEMFSGCTALSIEIPETVVTIGKDAFAGWTATQTITVNMSEAEAVAAWGAGWNGEATVSYKK